MEPFDCDQSLMIIVLESDDCLGKYVERNRNKKENSLNWGARNVQVHNTIVMQDNMIGGISRKSRVGKKFENIYTSLCLSGTRILQT